MPGLEDEEYDAKEQQHAGFFHHALEPQGCRPARHRVLGEYVAAIRALENQLNCMLALLHPVATVSEQADDGVVGFVNSPGNDAVAVAENVTWATLARRRSVYHANGVPTLVHIDVKISCTYIAQGPAILN